MKKIMLFLCMGIIGFSHAQTKDDTSNSDKLVFTKGSHLVNAGFFFNSQTTDNLSVTQLEEKISDIGIKTSYGYAISDNLFIGLGVGYQHRNREVELTFAPSQELKINNFNIFPYVRYYKGLGKRLSIFGQGEVQYFREVIKPRGLEELNSNGFFVGIRPGFVFMLSKNIALETTFGAFGYTTTDIDNGESNLQTEVSEFRLSLNFEDLVFGLSYYF
ncbi:MAG: outer membrane beta-barrel protein [Bacteroidota bacterium]